MSFFRRHSSRDAVNKPLSPRTAPFMPLGSTSKFPSPLMSKYDTPDPKGRSWLLDLPEQVLARIFTRLDRPSLTRCYRVCKGLNEILSSNSAIALNHLTMCNSLLVNPHALKASANLHHVPPSSAHLLSTLRERLTRFRNFTPRSEHYFDLTEAEGRLYEYLEGTLMRGLGAHHLSTEIAFYDLPKLGDWEDVEDAEDAEDDMIPWDVEAEAPSSGRPLSRLTERMEVDSEPIEATEEDIGQAIRRTKRFDFVISEFAVDPGQDLVVLVEVRPRDVTRYTMRLHLLSLSTFEPHPKAAQTVLEWPIAMAMSDIHLNFQICDDGLFVLSLNQRDGPPSQLCGWQWTTGRLAVMLKAFPNMSFESFVLLTPSSFVIPTIVTHLDPQSESLDQLDIHIDMSFTHHFYIYAFPPFSAIRMPENPTDPMPPHHTAIHIATIDLPHFRVDVQQGIPPPRLGIRTDPPPRSEFPSFPEGNVPAFVPTPESGLIVLDIACQPLLPEEDPHYVMCLLKSTLTQYLPAPTSPLLFQAFPRPAPVIPWDTLAPHVRMFGPDVEPPSWVCYVYQNRYVQMRPLDDDTESEERELWLFDFDPLRVRKEITDRQNETAPYKASRRGERGFLRRLLFDAFEDGSIDGIKLVTQEDHFPPDEQLETEIKVGSKLPYMLTAVPFGAEIPLIDGERIVGLVPGYRGVGRTRSLKTECHVMEF